MTELARVSHAGLELPASTRLGRVSHAAIILPVATRLARVSHAHFELPYAPNRLSGRPIRRGRSRLRVKHPERAAPATRRRIAERLDTALRGLASSPLPSDRELARDLLDALPPPEHWVARFELIIQHWSLILVALDNYDSLIAKRREEEAILVLMLAL